MKPGSRTQVQKGAVVGLSRAVGVSSSVAHQAPGELPGLPPGPALLAKGVEEEEGAAV